MCNTHITDDADDDLMLYIPFNIIKVILRQVTRLCAFQVMFMLEKKIGGVGRDFFFYIYK